MALAASLVFVWQSTALLKEGWCNPDNSVLPSSELEKNGKDPNFQAWLTGMPGLEILYQRCQGGFH
jgi:hypothetical protein